MERFQVNLRLDEEMIDKIDDKRIELRKKTGRFPTRSDVIRAALELHLGPSANPMPAPGRPRKKKPDVK